MWGKQSGQPGWNQPAKNWQQNQANQNVGQNNQQGWGHPGQGWGQGQGWNQPQQGAWGNSGQQGWNQGFQNQGFQNQGWNQQGHNINQGWNPNPNSFIDYSKHKVTGTMGLFKQGTPYVIRTALNTQFALDVSMSKSQKQKLKLIVYKFHGEPNQQFYFRQQKGSNGRYKILTNQKGMKTVQVPNSSEQMGVQIITSSQNNAINQFWAINPVQGIANAYTIRAFNGLGLDVENEKAKNDQKVIQWGFAQGKKNQIWIITPK